MTAKSDEPDSAARAVLPRVALALALIAAIGWFATHRSYFAAGHLETELRAMGRWAPVAFIALYTAAAVLFVPGSVMTLAGDWNWYMPRVFGGRSRSTAPQPDPQRA